MQFPKIKLTETQLKYILPAIGGIVFALTGVLAGFLMPSDDNTPPENLEIVSENINAGENIYDANANISQDLSTPEIKNIYVYVTGAVKNPGVYALSNDARIFHAVDSAGGFAANADTVNINLAETVTDEMHIHVFKKGEFKKSAQDIKIPGLNENNTRQNQIVYTELQSQKIDINNAPEEVLINLKGVGKVIARRIIDYRNKYGKFKTVEDLLNVRGIGAAKLKNMRGQIIIR